MESTVRRRARCVQSPSAAELAVHPNELSISAQHNHARDSSTSGSSSNRNSSNNNRNDNNKTHNRTNHNHNQRFTLIRTVVAQHYARLGRLFAAAVTRLPRWLSTVCAATRRCKIISQTHKPLDSGPPVAIRDRLWWRCVGEWRTEVRWQQLS